MSSHTLDELNIRLGGVGWIDRLGFALEENPNVPRGTVLVLNELGRVMVPDAAAFIAAVEWAQCDHDVRAIFTVELRRFAARWGVTTRGIPLRRAR